MTLPPLSSISWRPAASAYLIGKPIERTFGFTFQYQMLKIRCSSVLAKKSWRAAGYIYQVVPDPASTRQLDITSRFIPFGDSVIYLPLPDPYYRIKFRAMPWLDKVTFAVWEAHDVFLTADQLSEAALI